MSGSWLPIWCPVLTPAALRLSPVAIAVVLGSATLAQEDTLAQAPNSLLYRRIHVPAENLEVWASGR